jgi:hypothetical protein
MPGAIEARPGTTRTGARETGEGLRGAGTRTAPAERGPARPATGALGGAAELASSIRTSIRTEQDVLFPTFCVKRWRAWLRRGMVNFISQSRPKWAMPRQSRWVRDAQTTHEHSDTPRYTRVPIRYTPRVFPLIARTHKRRERTRAAALPGLRRRSCRAKQALTAPVGRVWPARTRAGVAWGSQRPKRTPHSTHTARHHF